MVERLSIHNVVATMSLGCKLDLHRIAWEYGGEYNSARFAAVQLRLENPRTTALIFGTGRLVLTGSRSEYAAYVALNMFYYLIWKLHPEASIKGHCIQNIVARGSLGSSIRIDAMSHEMALALDSTYEPEIFPGFRLGIRDPNLKFLLFVGGAVVIIGARNREDIKKAWIILRWVVHKYLTLNSPELTKLAHSQIIQMRLSSRKRKATEAELDCAS